MVSYGSGTQWKSDFLSTHHPSIHSSIHPSRWAGSLFVPKTLALIVTAGLYFLGQILFAL
jgi:hypothetical protein